MSTVDTHPAETPGPAPSEVDRLAAQIVEGWDMKTKREQFTRARRLARRQLEASTRQAVDAVPVNWERRIASAGATGPAIVWPGAPCAPDLVLPGRSPWSIDGEGIWFTSQQGRQFVSSPIVPTDDGYAALVSGSWVTIPRPTVPRGTPAKRLGLAVLEALSAAGVRFGKTITTGDRAELLDHQPAQAYASIWLTGIDVAADSIGNSPLRRLGSLAPEDDRPDGVEARRQLGEALSRQPADIVRRRSPR